MESNTTFVPANVTMSISVEAHFAGIHYWPQAPSEVGYLRTPHRHIFVVYARIAVEHNDRELEFILVKQNIERYIHEHFNMQPDGVCQLYTMSCEQIATAIAQHLVNTYGNREISVGVFEDDENGCFVEVSP